MSNFTRRHFLRTSLSTAGLVGLAPGAIAGAHSKFWLAACGFGLQVTLDMLQDSHFSPHLGSRFRLVLENDSAEDLELTEVTARASAPVREEGPQRRPFSLVFRSSSSSPRPQKIYKLEHASLGTLEIFLVPIGPDDQGQLYEAVFN